MKIKSHLLPLLVSLPFLQGCKNETTEEALKKEVNQPKVTQKESNTEKPFFFKMKSKRFFSWQDAANEMVKAQIIPEDITDKRLIEAMKNTPRHLFVPKLIQRFAYNDCFLPIGHGQTISQPYVVAMMTQFLDLKGNEKVLEIGTGSGYQAAILSKLVKECYTIEIVEGLAKTADSTLKSLNYKNVFIKWGDGYKGWAEHAPFDSIIITAAPEEIPEGLIKQLRVGGRMIVPVGKQGEEQDLLLIRKLEDGIKKEIVAPALFVPMLKMK